MDEKGVHSSPTVAGTGERFSPTDARTRRVPWAQKALSRGQTPGRVLRGRGTSSPPQLGQTPLIVSAQAGQKVHSKLQMRASPSGASGVPQRSHSVLSSSARTPSLSARELQGELDRLRGRRRPLHALALDLPPRREDDDRAPEHAREADLRQRAPATADRDRRLA